MRKASFTITEFDDVSYCDIPSIIGRLKNRGYALDDIIKTRSSRYKGKYLITAYKDGI